MNPQDTPDGKESDVPMSPEDSPRLQAIEALEAREIDAHPRPYDPEALRSKPRVQTPVTPPVHVAPPAPKPVVVKPVEPVKTVPVAPIPPPTPIVEAPKPEPVVALKPTPVVIPPKPATPKTPAAEMAEELANAPPTKLYQFFHNENGLRKPPIIVIAVIVVIILVVAGIFIAKSLT